MNEARDYLRFPIVYRIEHWLLTISFTTLAITGLIQKFPQAGLSIGLVGFLGGVLVVRIIHRVAATLLMLEAIYHLGNVIYRWKVRQSPPNMMLSREDVRNAWNAFRFNLRLSQERPKQGRYTFEEKVEYFSLIWGTLLMGVTGFMLWNPILTTRLVPGDFIPAAKAAHGAEAVLAVLAILVWHFYHVHLRHFNQSMITGYLPAEVMQYEHPLELEGIVTDDSEPKPNNLALNKRKRVFVPIYGGLACLMLVGIFFFTTFEQTAIKTIRPLEAQVMIFAPLSPTPMPPMPDFIPGTMTSWEDGVSELFATKCGFCHGGSEPISGLDLTDYRTAILGGTTEPAILPSDPQASGLVVHQSRGDHAVELTPVELAKVTQWIQSGAPER